MTPRTCAGAFGTGVMSSCRLISWTKPDIDTQQQVADVEGGELQLFGGGGGGGGGGHA